jgi:hypothetical protein
MTINKNVWLTGSHHNFPKTEELSTQKDIGRFLKEREHTTLLTEDMLNHSFMYTTLTDVEKQVWANFYASALRALASLNGFISFISLGVEKTDKGDEKIIHPEREWGRIHLASTGEFVLGFSHDTRHDNSPFYSLEEWLEKDWKRRADIINNVEKWSTPEIWRKFFLNRIQDIINQQNEEVSKLQSEINYLVTKAKRIQSLLPIH